LRFIKSRVIPDKEVLANLTHASGNDIKTTIGQWYGMSQTSRITRWLFSRPMRAQTLAVIRSVLAVADQRLGE
jgi:hypothetical protein